MANKRITPIAGEVVKELLSPEIYMAWDPVNDTGSIRFLSYEYIVANGEIIARTGEPEYLEVSYEDIALQRLGEGVPDPVTGIDMGNISGLGVMTLFKILFDKINNPPEPVPEEPTEPEPEPEEPTEPEPVPEEPTDPDPV